jgi:hypothetical protein
VVVALIAFLRGAIRCKSSKAPMRFLWAFRFYPGCMGEQQVRRTCDQPLAHCGILRSKIPYGPRAWPPAPLRGAGSYFSMQSIVLHSTIKYGGYKEKTSLLGFFPAQIQKFSQKTKKTAKIRIFFKKF